MAADDDTAHPEALDRIAEAHSVNDADAVRAGLDALASAPDRACARGLRDWAESGDWDAHRSALSRALAACADDALDAWAVEEVKSRSTSRKLVGIEVVGRRRLTDGIEEVRKRLELKTEAIVHAARLALLRLGEDDAVELVSQSLSEAREEELAGLLDAIDDDVADAARPLLEQALDGHPEATAVQAALDRLGGPSTAAAQSSDEAAATAAAQSSDETAAPDEAAPEATAPDEAASDGSPEIGPDDPTDVMPTASEAPDGGDGVDAPDDAPADGDDAPADGDEGYEEDDSTIKGFYSTGEQQGLENEAASDEVERADVEKARRSADAVEGGGTDPRMLALGAVLLVIAALLLISLAT